MHAPCSNYFFARLIRNFWVIQSIILVSNLYGAVCTRYAIIPQPQELVHAEGTFTITPATQIVINTPDLVPLAATIASFLGASLGKPITWTKERCREKNNIVVYIDCAIKNLEGYALNITPECIKITAATPIGAFYAWQTVRQLLPATTERQVPLFRAELSVPCISIHDQPRFGYRGLLLDVARHMMPLDAIKKLIDVMATYKFNTLHLHLTDDQGWRLEIKKYPKLQEVAAYRAQTQVGRNYSRPVLFDGKRYGGYYTHEDIKELVAYAHEKHITIIPEIEFPGHCLAALAAYPELGCIGKNYTVSTRWGVHDDVYCLGNEKTFDFITNVLQEVVTLFPSTYIHIGGDEVFKKRWEQCAACQQRMQVEGLTAEQLQSYGITRIEQIANSLGRSIIGWDEILAGSLAPNATVMSWLGTEGGLKAAKMRHKAIMTPHDRVYLDYYQSLRDDEPLAMGRYLPLARVYDYEPIASELSSEEAQYILGVQGNIWTEYIATPAHLEYMTFPRALALAEVAWTSANKKNYTEFIERLRINVQRLKARGVQYCEHGITMDS